jgi:glycosyltransferase involved in cell wall biosynthesis
MTQYSVGIPVRNEKDTLEDTVDSIMNQTVLPEKVYICVNGSTDGSLDLAHRLTGQYNQVIVLHSNPGKANAWNAIVKHCPTNYVMMTDGDVLLNREAAGHLLTAFERNPEAYVAGGYVVHKKPKQVSLFSRLCNPYPYDRIRPLHWLSGQLYMMKKDELMDMAGRYGIDLMPPTIINEDLLIEHIVRREDRLTHAGGAHGTVFWVNSFGEWMRWKRRIFMGQMQISEKYPYLGMYSVRDWVKWKKNIILNNAKMREQYPFLFTTGKYSLPAKETNRPPERIGRAFRGMSARLYIFLDIVVDLILRIGMYCGRKDYSNVWEEAKSTKVSLRQD